MHELSIAISIVELAAEEAERRSSSRVHALHLKLGPLAGVVKEALLFSYEIACKGTVLEGSRLIIEDTPVVIYCPLCQAEQILESIQRFCCPVCEAPSSDVRGGRELELVTMEITEASPEQDADDEKEHEHAAAFG